MHAKKFVFLFLLFLAQVNRTFAINQANGRIIGGSLARAGQFPFAAAIFTTTSDASYFCGGALLTNQWILTSGKCVDGVEFFTILLGSNKLNDINAHRVSSDTYVLHPEFDSETLDNDIGLIWLRLPIEFNDYRKPVDFLPFADLPTSSSTIGIGWGQVSDDVSGIVNDLNFVYLTTISDNACKSVYGNQITESMVCVDGNYNEGMCNGDSGSPLIQIISRGHSVVAGVASFRSIYGCETPDPSGYTKVYPFNDWIRNVTGKQ